MQTIQKHIEQLEQAGAFLDDAKLSSVRLALILIDNVAEITMYNRVRGEFAKDQAFRGSQTPLYTPNKRRDVLKYFDDKVNFLLSKITVIEADDAAFLKFGHALRNEAYHKETYHYDVIIPVTQTYLGIVCRLYPLIRTGGFSSAFTLPEAESEFWKRYAISSPFEFSPKALERICVELAAKRDCDPSQLAAALSRNLVRRIDEILGTEEERGFLETLMDAESEGDTDIDKVLKRIMFIASDEPESELAKTDEELRQRFQKWQIRYDDYRPLATVKTLRKWRDSAAQLAAEKIPGRMAERYSSIDRSFLPIEDLVHQAVHEYDKWVNNEVSRLRGN